jgi:hypothetical protein
MLGFNSKYRWFGLHCLPWQLDAAAIRWVPLCGKLVSSWVLPVPPSEFDWRAVGYFAGIGRFAVGTWTQLFRFEKTDLHFLVWVSWYCVQARPILSIFCGISLLRSCTNFGSYLGLVRAQILSVWAHDFVFIILIWRFSFRLIMLWSSSMYIVTRSFHLEPSGFL